MGKCSAFSAVKNRQLGSASLSTNASGGKLTDIRYYPYGETRSGTLATDRRYTGQRHESGLGLYDYNARYYDPALGRFIQADTIVPSPANPQAWNRYSYVKNNPLRYVDPTGHLTDDQIKEYTDYDTDEELAALMALNGGELYRLLQAMHLWDLFLGYRDGEKIIRGSVDLNERGRLRIGGFALEEIVKQNLTGGTLLRDFGNGTTYLAYQWGDGTWIPDNYPASKQFEYTYEVSPEEAAFWSLGGEAMEEFLEWIASGLDKFNKFPVITPIQKIDRALKDGVYGPNPGHAKGDIVMKAYYAVDQNPTSGASLPLTQIWVETIVVRGNAVIYRDWAVTQYSK